LPYASLIVPARFVNLDEAAQDDETDGKKKGLDEKTDEG